MIRTVIRSALTLAAGGMALWMAEQLLLRTPVRTAARAALGVLYLELLAQQIAGIFR
jgi:hypothetical protein